ncbi:MAG TPA: hypothetical protein VI094_11335 [Propionibacteriaceae bacterium]
MIGAAAIVAVYVLVCRPWMMRWGSTLAERDQPLPGDEIIQTPALRATRAIDIMCPPSDVWPWLVQLGYGPDRAGFYSYDWLENLIGLDIHSAARIAPELQQVAAGDHIPFGPDTDFRVELLELQSALVLRVRMHPFTGRDVLDRSSRLWLDWTWSFALRPKGQVTRLLVRTRGAWSHRLLSLLIQPLLEPVHFVMERRMLLGIRDRAEGSVDATRSSSVGHLEGGTHA